MINTTEKNFSIDRAAEKEIYRQVEDHIAHLITSRQFKPGDMIPSPPALAGELNVHELTVRRAVRSLQRRGVVTTRHGRGTFVTSPRQLNLIRYVYGEGLLSGKVSPYFTTLFNWVGQALWRANMAIEPLWMDDEQADNGRLCDTDALRHYRGFIFVAVGGGHPMLDGVRERRLPYVWWSHTPGPRHIVNDYAFAVRTGLRRLAERGAQRILVVGMGSILRAAQAEIAASAVPCEVLEVPVDQDLDRQELAAYDTMASRMERAMPDSIFFLDDVVAEVATRVILSKGHALLPELRVAVLSGLPHQAPLGLPITCVAFDTPWAAERTVALLTEQINGKDPDARKNTVPLRLIEFAANGRLVSEETAAADC